MEQRPEKVRTKREFQQNCKTIKEYAYLDNMNYPIRQQMEDSYFVCDDLYKDGKTGFFGVLDGHGGYEVVQFATEHIPNVFESEEGNKIGNYYQIFSDVLKKIDGQLALVGAADQGTCCCLALIKEELGQQKCWVANLGDTRAVLSQNGQAKRVSTDHKASSQQEIDRVKQAGGIIIRNRVSGQLAVSRALGDLDLKTEGVITTPDIQEFSINNTTQFLIIASDGLWDVCEDQKAVDLVKGLNNTQEMAKTLVDHALKSNSRDNVSVLVIQFKQ